MNPLVRRILFWAPRALSIVFIAFLSLFALDVFGEGAGFWDTLIALLRHLIPSFVLIVVLIFAWRWEWIGAVLCACAGLLYLLWLLPAPTPAAAMKLAWCMTIAAPAFAIAALFLANWFRHDEVRTRK
jgi:hypothetical protein